MEQVKDETIEISNEVEQAPQQPLTHQEQLTALAQRRTGAFPVKISHDSLKFLRNKLHQKVEWKGPNEAYLMIMSILTIDDALEGLDQKSSEPIQVQIPASTIESVNYFLNRVAGTGLDSAQKLFSISMMFRPAVEAMKKIDEEISNLEKELKSEKSA
jgi:hypothetical protein